jgi:quercetin dioxygenase-like cupin family protein
MEMTEKAIRMGGTIMRIKSILSHIAVASAASLATLFVATGQFRSLLPTDAQAQTGQRITDLFKQEMTDVMGRQLTVRLAERDPGNGSGAHRHPGSHTVGYILEGSYEVKIGDTPVRTLKAGEVFYEQPNALHAISRNPSTTEKLKYLIIQVSDPSKPATVPE